MVPVAVSVFDVISRGDKAYLINHFEGESRFFHLLPHCLINAVSRLQKKKVIGAFCMLCHAHSNGPLHSLLKPMTASLLADVTTSCMMADVSGVLKSVRSPFHACSLSHPESEASSHAWSPVKGLGKSKNLHDINLTAGFATVAC